MISIWRSCVDVYCLLLKECGESSECQLDILPAVGRCWAGLGWALGGGGADTGPGTQAIMQSAQVINQINRGEIEFIIQDQPEGEIDFNLKWYQFA